LIIGPAKRISLSVSPPFKQTPHGTLNYGEKRVKNSSTIND
jgi:hypothetical protein